MLVLGVWIETTIVNKESLNVLASANCLYCKRTDTFASFLYSYSYCQSTDECLADVWNYYNRYCPSGWKQGWQLDINKDCKAIKSITCPKPIVVNSSHVGSNFINST